MASNHDDDEHDNPPPPPKVEITVGETAKAVKLGALQGVTQAAIVLIAKHLP